MCLNEDETLAAMWANAPMTVNFYEYYDTESSSLNSCYSYDSV